MAYMIKEMRSLCVILSYTREITPNQTTNLCTDTYSKEWPFSSIYIILIVELYPSVFPLIILILQFLPSY